MDWIAHKAASLLKKTGKLTVVVQDNSPIHKSHEARACWSRWSEQGLLLFFLPAYCSDMNPIEAQWSSAFAQIVVFDDWNALRSHSRLTKSLVEYLTMNTI